jgi:enoyl-[acyl-carrier protein] reductase I
MEGQKAFKVEGKAIAVLGVADRDSLGFAIAKAFHENGARVRIGYQQKFLSRVKALAEELPGIEYERCDVQNCEEMEKFFSAFRTGGLDGLVHSIAFGAPAVFTDSPSEVSSADFNEAVDISAHSLARVSKYAKEYLNRGASVVTLSFMAAQKAMPVYGMMGVAKAALESLVRYLAVELGKHEVRVNAISAGPVETLAALSEIIAFKRNPSALERLEGALVRNVIEQLSKDERDEDELSFARRVWRRLQQEFARKSAIQEIIEASDIANTALFLASDASRKITGQVINVDGGFSACQIM